MGVAAVWNRSQFLAHHWEPALMKRATHAIKETEYLPLSLTKPGNQPKANNL